MANLALVYHAQERFDDALEYIEPDELVEITPKSIRIRKTYLKEADRKRNARRAVLAER